MRRTTSSVVLHTLSSFNIILISLAINGSTFCEQALCENDSPCRTTTTWSHRTEGEYQKGSREVSAECVCHGQWTGPLCNSQIHVRTGPIKGASLLLEFSAGPNFTSKKIEGYDKFTLFYWMNGSQEDCIMIQELTSLKKAIDGLVSNSEYTFCIQSGTADSCFPLVRESLHLPPNCVSVITGTITPVRRRAASVLSLPAIGCTVVIVLLVCALLVAVVVIRRNNLLLFDSLFGYCSCSNCWNLMARRRRTPRLSTATDLMASPDSPLVMSSKLEFAPSSSGKPKHRLSKRAWGYTCYKAKNDKKVALTTVLEYPLHEEIVLENVPLSNISELSDFDLT